MQTLKIKNITLKEVIADAKRIYPDLNTITALEYYCKIQESIGVFSQDRIKQVDSLVKWNLAKLITDAFAPDYDWQALGKTYKN